MTSWNFSYPDCLLQVMRHMEQLSSSGKIVGEFVPPSSYISSQLLEYVCRRNASLASLQTKVYLAAYASTQ